MSNEDIAARWRKQHDDGVQKLIAAFGDKVVSPDLGVLHDAGAVHDRSVEYDRQIRAAETVGDRDLAGRLKIAKSRFQPLPDPPQPDDGTPAHRIAEDHNVPVEYRHLLVGVDDADELRRRITALAEIGAAKPHPARK